MDNLSLTVGTLLKYFFKTAPLIDTTVDNPEIVAAVELQNLLESLSEAEKAALQGQDDLTAEEIRAVLETQAIIQQLQEDETLHEERMEELSQDFAQLLNDLRAAENGTVRSVASDVAQSAQAQETDNAPADAPLVSDADNTAQDAGDTRTPVAGSNPRPFDGASTQVQTSSNTSIIPTPSIDNIRVAGLESARAPVSGAGSSAARSSGSNASTTDTSPSLDSIVATQFTEQEPVNTASVATPAPAVTQAPAQMDQGTDTRNIIVDPAPTPDHTADDTDHGAAQDPAPVAALDNGFPVIAPQPDPDQGSHDDGQHGQDGGHAHGGDDTLQGGAEEPTPDVPVDNGAPDGDPQPDPDQGAHDDGQHGQDGGHAHGGDDTLQGGAEGPMPDVPAGNGFPDEDPQPDQGHNPDDMTAGDPHAGHGAESPDDASGDGHDMGHDDGDMTPPDTSGGHDDQSHNPDDMAAGDPPAGHDAGPPDDASGDGHDMGHDGGDTTPPDTSGGHDDQSHNPDDMAAGDPHAGHDDSGGHDGHDGHGAGTPAVELPRTPEEIEAFIAQVRGQSETQAHGHNHGQDASQMSEHFASLDLTPREEATHIAISDGDWFDASTWYQGNIPGDDAKVLIPEGIEVTYAGESDARLFTVRVDGSLEFATDTDSTIILDTMLVSPTGSLIIGTLDNPIQDNVSVDIVIANNGPIDTDWDPMLLSRGVITHGETSIHGAEKDSHEKVITDPMAGDTSVTFSELPLNWSIGDTIVIAGTEYDGHAWDSDIGGFGFFAPEDEVRVITSIQGNTVHFEEPLIHDHDTPRADLKTSVANYSRNVTIGTENPETAEVYERGHVMFLHSDNVDVRYAAFHELGRTDKSQDSESVQDFDTISYDSNVQGRYSLHLHRTGTSDLDDPIQVVGNAVWGSPGWGFVHHDSNADLINNASYDTFGAGFVAETGNETGSWEDNIAIFAEGQGWGEAKIHTRIQPGEFDTARSGDGFWFQGRLVESVNNIAASVNHGFAYFHRDEDGRTISIDAENFIYPDAFFGDETIGVSAIPILGFDGNEAFAARQGLQVVKAGPNQGHDVWTHIEDFTAWGVHEGILLEYTSHYLLTDIDIVGREDTELGEATTGLRLGRGTADIVVRDLTVDGFQAGFEFNNQQELGDSVPTHLTNYAVFDATFLNTDTDLVGYDPNVNLVTTIDAFNAGQDGPLDAFTGRGEIDLQLDPVFFDWAGDFQLEITGRKTDSLGTVDFPSGIDHIRMNLADVAQVLEDRGYFQTSDDEHYFLLDVYFSDRLTGDVYYETTTVFLDDTYGPLLGYSNWDFSEAVFRGVQDITTDANNDIWAGNVQLDQAFEAVAGRQAHIAELVEQPLEDSQLMLM